QSLATHAAPESNPEDNTTSSRENERIHWSCGNQSFQRNVPLVSRSRLPSLKMSKMPPSYAITEPSARRMLRYSNNRMAESDNRSRSERPDTRTSPSEVVPAFLELCAEL